MKKREFYINCVGEKEEGIYPKVSGWVEEIETLGTTLQIGYYKIGTQWIATELKSGFKCNILSHTTRKQCVEEVHRIKQIIAEVLEKNLKNDYGKKWIEPFRNFVNANGGF
jgi:hypothetical protein